MLDAPASLSSGHESFSESALPCRASLKPVILLNATDVPALLNPEDVPAPC